MYIMVKTSCEIELEKIQKKARQRHDRYMKNKDKVKKIPLKRDIIKKLEEENLFLRQQLIDEVSKHILEPNNSIAPLGDGLNNGIMDDQFVGAVDADEAVEAVEAEEVGAYDTIYDVKDEFENINPMIGAVGAYDTIYDVKDDFENVNPMIEADGEVCKCKNVYTYDVIIEKMEMMVWPNEKIKNTMIDTIKKLFVIFDRIPTCKGAIDKFKNGLFALDIPVRQKRVMVKILLLTISKLNIELDDKVINEYYFLYSLFV